MTEITKLRSDIFAILRKHDVSEQCFAEVAIVTQAAVQGTGEVDQFLTERNEILRAENHKQAAEIARLQGELRKALREVSKWARVAGEAQGKLAGSELAGVVDGWREKCEALEVDNASLTDELAKMGALLAKHPT